MGVITSLEGLRSRARAYFPALAGGTVFLDNAGGSQAPEVVARAMYEYMLRSYVQLGADYELSRRATRTVARAHEFLRTFMNVTGGSSGSGAGGGGGGEVILGASTSELCNRLAAAYGDVLPEGAEVIVCETGHESNIGPWVRLAARGVVVKHWRADPATGEAPLAGLAELLSERTRIVAFPQVSNILGAVIDPRPVVDLVKRDAGPRARVVCDGVAFAPHRAIDVAESGVDYFVYSTYKVFGPHMAAMFGTRDALADVTGPNHFFVPKDELPRKFELGGVSHEGAAGILALDRYLRDLIGRERMADPGAGGVPFDRSVVEEAFAAIEALEAPLTERMLAFLRSRSDVRIVGPGAADRSRVCTVSFLCARRTSREVVLAANAEGLGIRHGHFYAHRLCKAMGIDADDGVVRVSLAHYNTPEEVDRLIGTLERVL